MADHPEGIIFEYYQTPTRAIRVCAVDEATGIEVVVICDSRLSQQEMQTVAMRKLDWVMDSRANTASARGVASDEGGRGPGDDDEARPPRLDVEY
jgi:hypothetical protein